jgi:hypothetical protein
MQVTFSAWCSCVGRPPMALYVRRMDNNESGPGVRLHVHEPDHLWPWVFRQHQVWVDFHGSEHEIESMTLLYIGNVIAFCRERAEQIRTLVYIDWVARALELALNGAGVEGARAALEAEPEITGDPEEWLEATPLMLALRRRIES